jgi:adenylosuccinate lyase
MIDRYTHPEMAAIWTDQTRYSIWLDIERFALEGLVQEGAAPKEALDAFNAKAAFDVNRVNELELQLKHDVIAFLTNVAEYVGPLSRYVHKGMTSSDVVDTCLAVQMRRAGKLIYAQLQGVLTVLKTRSVEFKDAVCIGRSHGIHAEPTTFGIKLAGWYAELRRQSRRLEQAIETIAVGKLSGAVGMYGGISPAVEHAVMTKLELKAETVATQVVARDRHAEFMGCLAQIGSSIERFAVEIRHLQRTEVGEVMEGFTPGQKGSSAMPHKRNPILSENLCGLARLLRSYAQACFENVALWHERDISHSSVERVALPDACITLDFMLRRFGALVSNLVVSTDRMRDNLELTRGTVFSGHLLLALVDRGITREDAYAAVQKLALAALDGGLALRDRAKTDAVVSGALSADEIDSLFDLKRYLREVDRIVTRALAS